jgi:phospholipid/cholesterol/gamma-HCH transport system substrate-binding protein
MLIKLAIFMVAALFCGAMEIGTLTGPHVGSTHSYHAIFDTSDGVSGLRAGNPVRAAGVPVGKVTGLTIMNATHAKVTFTANDDQVLTTNTSAVVRYANLLGQRYLALAQEGTGLGTPLNYGATIPASRTAPALSLTALFSGFRPLFSAVSPTQVNELSTDIVDVLQGQTDRLDDLVTKTADLTTNLASRDQTFSQILDSLTTLLSAAAQHDDELAASVTSLHSLTSELHADAPALLDSLSSIDGLTGSVSGLLSKLENHHLPQDLADLKTITDPVAANTATLGNLLVQFTQAFGDFDRVTQNGNFVNAYPCELHAEILGTVHVSAADVVNGLSEALGGGLTGLLGKLGISVTSLAQLALPVPLTLPDGNAGGAENHSKVCS